MKSMTLHLKVWRQKNAQSKGKMVDYTVTDVSPDMSFLEMLDVLNEDLIRDGGEPIEFDNDCREGICGMCSLVIDGVAHGPWRGAAVCQLHMREYKDGDTITVEPWRAKAFPVIKDLVVDRTAFDRIIEAGGYISVNAGAAPDANAIPIPKEIADEAMDAAACIGCGACVAACPNASASLFAAAKISQLALLPQGHPERKRRVIRMADQMDKEGFGDCSNHAECEAVCPKEISISHIARMKREYMKANLS
ncbi:succinate dehydrogenase/fumarate reductase iron-sulfur subunit [candidate division KSB1 bacterium]|nr:succinate dehydrogenase/fumarate reductase iron-sulfur subunit [candidate division KSB1 bacterium]NIR72646.1 succinate dehydrogenase/fumarate reductase iron-sulfur subunit [candidate division KSB1 bacterium]NIS23676.1 succinate dehydrogenase/fumarate reductase iron-sulfur subunit [candidate division KSB1 bacterium]NIT70596.1 succinate dehydrogenase/fumarate reductase iron-sulfur subunit [candidate division KSB1 bacterium]NIU24324.1 succinate dehydrogenase/fumarate reductase iron-sulfur subun